MDNFLAFGNFDIIAYLMVGLAMFMVLDLVLSFGFLYRTKWNTGSVTGIVILAYLGGHLISIPSRGLFETWAIGHCLGNPVVHLMLGTKVPKTDFDPETQACVVFLVPADKGQAVAPSCQTSFLCEYAIRPIVRSEYFEKATQNVLQRIARNPEHSKEAASFFREAFVAAKHDPNSYERMDIFQRLSILFRNMAFLAFAALSIVVVKATLSLFGKRFGDRHLIYYGVRPWMLNGWVQFVVFLALTIGLFDRYLFFHRLFALEAVTAFAYAPLPFFD